MRPDAEQVLERTEPLEDVGARLARIDPVVPGMAVPVETDLVTAF